MLNDGNNGKCRPADFSLSEFARTLLADGNTVEVRPIAALPGAYLVFIELKKPKKTGVMLFTKGMDTCLAGEKAFNDSLDENTKNKRKGSL